MSFFTKLQKRSPSGRRPARQGYSHNFVKGGKGRPKKVGRGFPTGNVKRGTRKRKR